MLFFVRLVTLLAVGMGGHAAELTLKNTSPTNWGFWGDWDNCSAGSFAAGFELKVEGRQWSGDDTALNAIKLFCASPLSPADHVGSVLSSEGAYGAWGQVSDCQDGLLTGFALRSEEDRGLRTDDTAANNLRMFCSNPKVGTLTGDGMSWGSWGTDNRCLRRQAVCGIRTQVAIRQGFMDDVGLNNVEMTCCDVPNPAASCTPTDAWSLVKECDNIQSTKPLTCKFDKSQGVSVTRPEVGRTLSSLGYETGDVGSSLANAFAGMNGSRTELDWAAEVADTWKDVLSTGSQFTVGAGKLARVYQVVGTCGPFTVQTRKYRLEEVDNPFS